VTSRLSAAWLARAALATLAIPPLLPLVPLPRLTAWIGGTHPTRTEFDEALVAARVDRWLARLPPPWRHTCLKRAAVLFHLLAHAGRPATLVIGVRRDTAGALGAHAWLVREGTVILETDPAHSAAFREIARFGPGA
jgi:hypothetical protein